VLAAQRRLPSADQRRTLPGRAETEALIYEQFNWRHRVVHLEHIEVLGPDPRLLVELIAISRSVL
jgi:hypothetical protein